MEILTPGSTQLFLLAVQPAKVTAQSCHPGSLLLGLGKFRQGIFRSTHEPADPGLFSGLQSLAHLQGKARLAGENLLIAAIYNAFK